eukprot:6132531-Pleurochrysis_carterae.AAC.1
MMYSLPASRAARNRFTVRRTSSLAWRSGGPPSEAEPDEKNRDTEKVEQGGEATIAVYAPDLQRSSRR